MVSKQRSPKLNKQQPWYESLPEGLILPTRALFTQILVTGFILGSPNQKQPGVHQISHRLKELKTGPATYQQVSPN